MTIVLVILAVLILLAVLFLIFHVSKLSKNHRELMSEYYSGILDHFINLNDNINTKTDTTTSIIGAQQQEVIKLTNKVEEGLTYCGNQTRELKDKFGNLETRITAPIDKINDTHNRIKTLGKGCVASDELREIVAQVTNAAVTHGVDQVRTMFEEQVKTKAASKTKKTVKAPVTEVKA